MPPQETAAPSVLKVLIGFLLSGLIFALPGAIMPAWQHLGEYDFSHFGNYFLALTAGVMLAARIAPAVLAKWGLQFLLVFACSLACGGLAFLALVSPPVGQIFRIEGMLVLGLAGGMLNMGLFHAISASYREDPAISVALGGAFFGIGSLIAALLVAGTFYAYTVPSILLLIAIIPAFFALMYARSKVFLTVDFSEQPSLKQAFKDFLSPGALLFALLLFFQFGNEWAIAGWLPVYLMRKVPLNPETSLWLLAFYWLALLTARFATLLLLHRIGHGRLLFGTVVGAFVGCFFLWMTDNLGGAIVGVLLVGMSFGPIYPLVAERIGRRFTYFHPGYFNGIFSFALVGGMLAPGTLGHFAARLEAGINIVMFLPLLGSCMVLTLLLLIFLEAKVTGR